MNMKLCTVKQLYNHTILVRTDIEAMAGAARAVKAVSPIHRLILGPDYKMYTDGLQRFYAYSGKLLGASMWFWVCADQSSYSYCR